MYFYGCQTSFVYFCLKIICMAKDIFHDAVRSALEKEGWNITADPYRVKILGVQHDCL